jgi:O-antigen/teichoic acid export membrane protein
MIKNILSRALKNHHLALSSFNLMLATGITAAFGFVFWIVVARSFSTGIVGLATTLISVSGLISLLGLAGFDTIFIRFLSKSKRRNDQINSGLVITAITSAFISLFFCLLIPILSPRLRFVDNNLWYIISFVVFTIFTTWNTLTNAALIAYRRTSFVLLINIIFSAIKMSLPFIVRSGGPMTIFLFVGIAQAVNVLLSMAALAKYFDYVPSFRVHFDIIKQTLRFGMIVYFSTTLSLLPATALPIIVVDKLGATAEAYFYIAFTIANLLYTIAYSTAQATLAEASHDEEHLMAHIRKSITIMSCLLIPAITLVVLICPWVLSLFNAHYKYGATGILRIMAISGLAIMFYSILKTLFVLTNNLKAAAATSASNALSIVILGLVFAKHWGLIGIGWAWFIGSFVSVFVGVLFVFMSIMSRRYLSSEAL